MSVQAAIYAPDYFGSSAAAPSGFTATLTGTVTAGTATGPIFVGPNKLIRIFASSNVSTTGTQSGVVLRYTMGNSNAPNAASKAPAPTSSSPFMVTNQVLEFVTGPDIDSINLNVLASDNIGGTVFIYSITILSKF